MAEWKTDTEEVKQIVKKCRDFKGSFQEEKCAQFIKNLDGYAREILLERRKIELQLQGAIEELRKAKRNESGAKYVLRGLQVGSLLSFIFPLVLFYRLFSLLLKLLLRQPLQPLKWF
ncbi:hypothetical protein BTM325_05700 [Helicobacter pylori]